MARKLSEIGEFVDSSSEAFRNYLLNNIDSNTIKVLESIEKEAIVYIFSGVIRNFFLGITSIRDLDVVISREIDVKKYFQGYTIRTNSFGGYKISNEKLEIDIWFLENSWAFQHQKVLNFELEKYVPSTAFFNFSSVVYNINDHAFSYTRHFLRFIRDKQIDVVYKPNSNYELCIVNSFYYADKYHLKLSEKLKEHILYLVGQRANNFEAVQIKHFGKVLYTPLDMEGRIALLQAEEQAKAKLFILHKKQVSSQLFHNLKKDFSHLDVVLNIQVDNEEYHNFTGPELFDIVLFLRETSRSPSVIDALKKVLRKILLRYKTDKTKIGEKVLSIRYEDRQHRNMELNVEFYKIQDIHSLVDDAMKILSTDENEKYFSNADFVNDFNHGIQLLYNSKEMTWEATNFRKQREFWDQRLREVSEGLQE